MAKLTKAQAEFLGTLRDGPKYASGLVAGNLAKKGLARLRDYGALVEITPAGLAALLAATQDGDSEGNSASRSQPCGEASADAEVFAGQDAEPSAPAWVRINALFVKHGLPAPPVRLRDELVVWLCAYEGRPL